MYFQVISLLSCLLCNTHEGPSGGPVFFSFRVFSKENGPARCHYMRKWKAVRLK